MSSFDKKIKKILTTYANLIVPVGMPNSEIKALAKRSHLSWLTLRSMRTRKSFSADTLIRALIGIGVEEDTLSNLNPKNTVIMDKYEREWYNFGKTLNEKEKKECIELLKYILDFSNRK